MHDTMLKSVQVGPRTFVCLHGRLSYDLRRKAKSKDRGSGEKLG